MVHLDGCDDEDLARLAATDAWEITFMPEGFVMPDGTMVAGYGALGTGNAFQVLRLWVTASWTGRTDRSTFTGTHRTVAEIVVLLD